MVSVVSDPVPLSLGTSGCEVLHWPWGAATECTVAHGGHSITGAAALEGPPQRGLEGQDILPLVPAAPAPSGLHQVGTPPLPRDRVPAPPLLLGGDERFWEPWSPCL